MTKSDVIPATSLGSAVTDRSSPEAPTGWILVALGLTTACTLAFQVVFTRLLSSVVAYHFSFLAISLALVGTGAGALLIYVRPAWFDRRSLQATLVRWTTIYAVLLILAPFLLVRLDYTLEHGNTFGFAVNLFLACVLATAPALAAGVVVALAIRGYTTSVSRVYAADLVGAGIGAVAVVPLLRFPAPNVIVGLGLVAALAAVCFARSDLKLVRPGLIALCAGVAVLVCAGVTGVLHLPPGYASGGSRVADRWTPLSRVEGYRMPRGSPSVVFYDRVFSPVAIVRGHRLPTWKELLLGPPSIGYALTGPGHALVIGGGGGRDIYNALTSGQRVDVIELNDGIRRVVDDDLKAVSGSPYSRPGVSTTIGDGRAILAQRDTKYNQIHLGFTDTLSAGAAQGFALTENNLYTVEAFDEYLSHLAPKGILNVSRLERLVGDEAIRATVLTMAALERHGVQHPERNIVVIRGTDAVGTSTAPYETVLARLEPWNDRELAEIRHLAKTRGDGVAFAPGGPYYGAWRQLAAATSWHTFCNDYPMNVCPPTDDKPFFFNMRRLNEVAASQDGYHYGIDPYDLLLLTLGILVVLSVVGMILPLKLARPRSRPPTRDLAYFVSIGLGFMLVEVVFIQRFVLFLGFPTYALSVVLFALLLFTGVGAAFSAKVAKSRRGMVVVLAAIVGLVMIAAFALQPLLRELIGLPFSARVGLTILLLMPFGLALGMPMPLGLTRFRSRCPDGVPFAWGVNGVASVLASVLGVVIAINFGFLVASLVAAVCYLAALVLIPVRSSAQS